MTTITDALDRYGNAIRALDPEALVACYATDARVTDGMHVWRHDTRDAWAAWVHEWLGMLEQPSEFRIDHDRVLESGDLAVVEGNAFYGARLEGDTVGMTTRITLVWRREGDDWLVVHEHTSVPFDEQGNAVQWEA